MSVKCVLICSCYKFFVHYVVLMCSHQVLWIHLFIQGTGHCCFAGLGLLLLSELFSALTAFIHILKRWASQFLSRPSSYFSFYWERVRAWLCVWSIGPAGGGVFNFHDICDVQQPWELGCWSCVWHRSFRYDQKVRKLDWPLEEHF